MKKLSFSFLFFAIACIPPRKTEKDDYFYCDFSGRTTLNIQDIENNTTNSLVVDVSIEELVNRITALSFPYTGFRLIEDKNGKVEVARAIISRRRAYRLIEYNKNKLQNIDLKSPNDVAAILGVFAHELGHLTFGHLGSNYENELLADRYAGWVLKKMNINRGLCIEALDKYIPPTEINGNKTHPSKKDRINAFQTGWDRADVDSRFNYSVCCDTSLFSSFNIEGLFITKGINDSKPCFVDIIITTFNEKSEVVQIFDKQILRHLKIEPDIGKPVILFKNLNYVILDKRFYKMKIEICECIEPCDGINNERQCPTVTELLMKHLEEIVEIPFADFGYMLIRFKK